jgi:hypothetical protein
MGCRAPINPFKFWVIRSRSDSTGAKREVTEVIDPGKSGKVTNFYIFYRHSKATPAAVLANAGVFPLPQPQTDAQRWFGPKAETFEAAALGAVGPRSQGQQDGDRRSRKLASIYAEFRA